MPLAEISHIMLAIKMFCTQPFWKVQANLSPTLRHDIILLPQPVIVHHHAQTHHVYLIILFICYLSTYRGEMGACAASCNIPSKGGAIKEYE